MPPNCDGIFIVLQHVAEFINGRSVRGGNVPHQLARCPHYHSDCALLLLGCRLSKSRWIFIKFMYNSLKLISFAFQEVNWGSSTQAQTYREALGSIQQLVQVEEHVKNYRPQILALTGAPGSRPALIDFAYLICKQNSMLICGQVVKVN